MPYYFVNLRRDPHSENHQIQILFKDTIQITVRDSKPGTEIGALFSGVQGWVFEVCLEFKVEGGGFNVCGSEVRD